MSDFIAQQEKLWQKLLKTLPSNAKETGMSSCVKCGRPCWVRPGILSKVDLSRLAVNFSMTEHEFFYNYCMVDEIHGILLLILKRKHQKGGVYVTAEQSYSVESPCFFYDEKSRMCTVHEIKPQQCAQYKCWEEHELDLELLEWDIDELMNLGWDGKFE